MKSGQFVARSLSDAVAESTTECGTERTKEPIGTIRYMSLAAHRGKPHTPYDDVESLVYLVKKLVTGSLPWDNRTDKRMNAKNNAVHRKVQSLLLHAQIILLFF
jgi:hypothetical protein